MARGRKSKYVKILTSKDQELIRGLSQVGITSKEQIKGYLKINEERLKQLQNSGYIKQENMVVKGRTKTIYTLDSLGQKYCRNELGLENFYKWNTRQIYHDLKLAEAYYNFPSDIRYTWRNETDLLNEYQSTPGTLPVFVDATIQVGNEIIAIEAIGIGYTKQVIQEKIDIANTYFDGIKLF